jgi:hypothetical protein
MLTPLRQPMMPLSAPPLAAHTPDTRSVALEAIWVICRWESQFLTIKSLVVIPDIDHASTIAPDGTGFNVSNSRQPGSSYDIYISLHNASEVHQSAELTVEAPGSVTVDVQASMGSAAAPDVIQTAPDRWTIIHSGQPKLCGPFDLTITVYSSKFMSNVDGRLRFELKASEYVAQRPQLAGLVY